MSRIGKSPIPIPDKVNVTLDGLAVTVKGPKGELKRTLPDGVTVTQVDNTIVVAPSSDKRRSRERHGLCRTLVANMVEGGRTPVLPAAELAELGYRIAAYPLTLLSSAVHAMQQALAALRDGLPPAEGRVEFEELKRTVGFDDYYATEARYARDPERPED